MGSCASLHRNSDQSQNLKRRLSFETKNDNLDTINPPSPIKSIRPNGDTQFHNVALKSQWFPCRSTTTFHDYGTTKEESFFDSRPWLDSDCEDDFYSVNGEFTPSRGNTPVHQDYPLETPGVSKALSGSRVPGSIPVPAPEVANEKKKKLLELFRENIEEDDQNTDGHTKSAQSTPYLSGTNSVCFSERSINEDPLSIREKSLKSAQCCLPGLASCRSFSERRRKMSPAVAVKGKP